MGKRGAYPAQTLKEVRRSAMAILGVGYETEIEVPVDTAAAAHKLGVMIQPSSANTIIQNQDTGAVFGIEGYSSDEELTKETREKIAFFLAIYVYNLCPQRQLLDEAPLIELISEHDQMIIKLFMVSLMCPDLDIEETYQPSEIIEFSEKYGVTYPLLKRTLE